MPRSYEFPASNRIKKRQDFVRIQNSKKKLFSRHFVIAMSNPVNSSTGNAGSRLGVTVTKKVDKRAVRRNYLKRRIKEVFRLNNFKLKYPLDIVVIARKDAIDLSYQEIETELQRTLKRGKLCSYRCKG